MFDGTHPDIAGGEHGAALGVYYLFGDGIYDGLIIKINALYLVSGV